jgi:hypothetical protein
VTGGFNIGGLVGANGERGGSPTGATIQNATATGTVTGTGSDGGIGGISGFNTGTIRNTQASGAVTAGNFLSAGGIIGINNGNGTIQAAAASGSVTVVNGNVGGLAGTSDGIIRNATASGSVAATEDPEFNGAGGLVGDNGETGIIQETFAVGTVTGENNTGGLMGTNRGTVKQSYFDQQATGQNTSAGSATGLTTARMQGQAATTNMSGLDFGSVWQTQTNDYPTLTALQQASDQSETQDDVDLSDLNGIGTQDDPYEISNASQLQAMEDDLSANYTLVSDVDASNTAQFNGGTGFDPVGDVDASDKTEEEFNGSFDGNGRTITGLTINRSEEGNIGLRSSVEVGTQDFLEPAISVECEAEEVQIAL